MSHSNEQAENAVLAAVMSQHVTHAQLDGLRAEDFTGHRVYVFEAVERLYACGAAINVLTLSEALKTAGRLVEVGGPAGLMRLDPEGAWVLPMGLRENVTLVKDLSRRRKLAAEAQRILDMTHDTNVSPDRIAALGAQALLSTDVAVGEEPPDIDIVELVEQWNEYMDRAASGAPMGLDNGGKLLTGIEVLDGLKFCFVNNLNVVGGRASMGKTALVAEMCWNWLVRDIKGGIIGLEDGTKWLTRRHLSRALGIPVGDIGNSRLADYKLDSMSRWMESASTLFRRNLRIHRAGGIDSPGLLAIVQRWIGSGARWVVIDHGLRVNYGDDKRYDRAIGKTLDTLATLGDRNKCAIIVNWHLNRDGEDEVRPKMRDYKESGYLDAAARAMLGLWEQSTRPGFLLATGVKATEGKRDWTAAIERDAEHALVKSSGGYEVDFAREQQEAKRAADEAKALNGKKSRLFG